MVVAEVVLGVMTERESEFGAGIELKVLTVQFVMIEHFVIIIN